jgi:hypothetical protein
MSTTSNRKRRSTAIGAPALAPVDAHGSMWLFPAALLLGLLLIVIASGAHAALYKWTDERGVVHYSDHLPPDAVNRARFELNRQGLAIKKTEQARPTAPRVAKTESEEQLSRQAERDRLLAARRDRAIMESYTTEAEIDLAKSRALATIDGQVQSAEAFVAQMEKRREELEGQKATFAPRPVPGSIAREIETIDGEVARQHDFIEGRRKEAATVAARYDFDKQRFRELRGGSPTSSVVTTDDGRYSASQPVGIELARAPAQK